VRGGGGGGEGGCGSESEIYYSRRD